MTQQDEKAIRLSDAVFDYLENASNRKSDEFIERVMLMYELRSLANR